MNQLTIAVVGISGVGKTTFLRTLAREVEFQHLTAGSLISAARAAGNAERDRLRLSDIDENQRLLIEGFSIARTPEPPLAILDGHVVIHAADGLHAIGSHVFSELGLRGMIHLVSDPARISANRTKDTGRDRPQVSIHELEQHQSASIAAAEHVSETLGVPFLIASVEDIALVTEFLSRIRP